MPVRSDSHRTCLPIPCLTNSNVSPSLWLDKFVQQTVKELVDNAIDACRCRSSEQDAPTVRVVLRRRPNRKDAEGESRVGESQELEEEREAVFVTGVQRYEVLQVYFSKQILNVNYR